MINVTKNVVMSMAYNYKAPEFQRFILPLRKYYQDDIVLIINPKKVTSEILSLGMEFGIKFVDIGHHSQSTSSQKAKGLSQHVQLMNSRPLLFSKLCDCYVGGCFATDFRDVFFQSNPFEKYPTDADILFSKEGANWTISRCKHNRRWIRDCFGLEVLRKIGKNSPINAGTILGSRKGFQVFAEVFQTLTFNKNIDYHCNDQGIVNFMWYTDLLKDITAIAQDQGRGIVNTLGLTDFRENPNKYRKVDGSFTNDDGTVSPVIHQYDRFPVAVAYIDKIVKKLIDSNRTGF